MVIVPRRVLAGTYWLAGSPLRTPIKIRVTADSNSILTREVDSGVFGVGADLAKSVADLRAALIEHRDTLEESQSLSPSLAAQLAILQRILL